MQSIQAVAQQQLEADYHLETIGEERKMSDFYYHAVSSAKMFGGEPEAYIKIHAWVDRGKFSFADFRHRALTHHAEGIWEAIEHFGPTITTSTGVQVPVKRICEAHVLEDLGTIPSLKDWLGLIKPERWMAPEPNLLFRKGKLNQLLEQLQEDKYVELR